MEFDMQPYVVYIRVDESNRIIDVNSDAFLIDTDGWMKIDEGFGDKYHHAQGNYLDKPLMDERGIYRYKLEDGKPVERTTGEMDADYVPPEEKPATDNSALAEQVAALQKRVDEQAAMLASYEAAYQEGVQSV